MTPTAAPRTAYDELQWRGLVFDHTESIPQLLAGSGVIAYNGFDPTGDSLHIGHTVPLIALARLQRFGHVPIAVAGGGTGMIGDPSGKSAERNLLTREQIEFNVACIKKQLARLLDFEVKSNPARLVNNADWLLPLNLVEFLRDTGKHFTVNYMLAKDSVKTRVDRGEGLSFTEFSYMLLQSYDFLHLHDTLGCTLQTGGSDQWGNITAGCELIRRVRGAQAHGMVYHLIVKADGTKFGKTESGSVWLDPEQTSPYRFFQFWLNTDDRDVIRYLKFFTFFTREEIAALEASHAEHPGQREAHRSLAREMTRTIHGETALARAEEATQVLFGGEISGLSAAEIADIFDDVPSCELPREKLEGAGMGLVDLLVAAGVAKSRGEARRSLAEGAIYVNNVRAADGRAVTLADMLEGKFILLRKGRRNYTLVRMLG
jgi:tyrosyl-tRNA synthetase